MSLRLTKSFALSRPSSLLQAFRTLSLAPTRSLYISVDPAKGPPEYPYGPARFFKQSNTGLYGGSTIQFGNKISKGRNKGKTRRTWKPNIRHEELYSEALGKTLQLKVQHRVLRTIKKVGGLDQYLLGDKPARIKELGIFGWNLRWKVMQSKAMQKKFKDEQKELELKAAAELESNDQEKIAHAGTATNNEM
ncbi:conserved hypothetical protein [Histoplasma mississippiense (nom. inval.)]|uniref:mitochondrial 54S ribosomal protein YmL24/YmL14 n=1 Tax=Ajellomyces capsulatus (strain NAm1 / WU24) TaxID=2059318 RepID=UPI000157B9CE|nr:mitochondrial 54S ribosomal protein YmL24/YmL14 [Histoplasma mississippiense (nom. inval.)]EDN03807.1 conserved hypothetical protein [Histoplasma mississippiense (nom. inval.)]